MNKLLVEGSNIVYHDKSHFTVRSALADLLGDDLLYQSDNGYVVYDRLFGLWLAKK